ncbi:hypothetical protein J6TS1_02530 [Siminovitchia terrae]|uniref:Uncharacterized protein n=1 Tax=Siminovitchia terrae TaxID=1914933 RepID=A0ABQ4KQS1_SIMTE|nr:hypothetical protein [Siminovitchia terrae]GIN94383.1 hypothetical protein J6TS1_02530 [Siminovitchia terrae]
MNAYWYPIQLGFKPRLNKVKASGGCHRFSEEIYRVELDKIWAQMRQGAFDQVKYFTLLFINFIWNSPLS